MTTPPPSTNRHVLTVLVALLTVIPAWAAEAAAPGAAPKTHTLFVGADLEVQIKGEFLRVRDVSGDAFVVNDHGQDRSVPMNGVPVSLQVLQTLKLTTASATIAGLKSERTYTSANDPVKRFLREQPGTAAQDTIGMADGNALFVSNLAAAAGSVQTPGGGYSGGGIGNAGALASQAQAAAANAGTATFAEANNMGAYVSRMQGELAKELFDAMEVTFEVSSAKPLTDPYLIIVARYHEADAAPGKTRNWIFAKTLPPIDARPHKVRVREGGFPPGFVMDSCQVHLYDHGVELATNVADKRVELTSDEAFQYLVLEHLATHKGADAPATPVMGRVPPDLAARLLQGEFAQPYFVKVSREGLPGEAFADAACRRPVVDPYLCGIFRGLRFRPALVKGQPVDAVVPVRLADLH